jgi:hypothetical protein
MADRPFIKPNTQNPIINGASMATSITGPPTYIQLIPGISYDILWAGAPVGTFSVQVSNSALFDAEGNYIAGSGNWTTIPQSAFTGVYPTPAGSAGNGFLDVVGTEACWVRLVYNAVSGTGTLTVVAAAKVL